MTDINFKTIQKPYFIGIGGIGMSAIARMFLHEGKVVAGSDLSESEITRELVKHGATVHVGEPAAQVPEGTDFVIYTVAIPKDHTEFVDALAKNIPTLSYPETLGQLSRDKFTIAIAGSHGKTTTTAMVAQILIEAGLDPTVIVGSLLKGKSGSTADHSNFIAGKSEYFVVEACEYKRSFLNLQPKIAVITNIDDDHLDYYKTFEGVQQGFREFIDLVDSGGAVVTDPTSPKIEPVLKGFGVPVVDYTSLKEEIVLKIPGKHNIANAKAALAVASILGVDKNVALKALSNFAGTWRRFEYKGETSSGVHVYDDYAHHPSEIAATVAAAREKFPTQKIVFAYQPHLYSRTKEHFNEFGTAFAGADEVLLLPIYAAREPHDPTVSSELLAEKMKEVGVNVRFVADFEAAASYLSTHLKKGDVFFSMGAGDIATLGDKILTLQ